MTTTQNETSSVNGDEAKLADSPVPIPSLPGEDDQISHDDIEAVFRTVPRLLPAELENIVYWVLDNAIDEYFKQGMKFTGMLATIASGLREDRLGSRVRSTGGVIGLMWGEARVTDLCAPWEADRKMAWLTPCFPAVSIAPVVAAREKEFSVTRTGSINRWPVETRTPAILKNHTPR
jgi:hypothetical protein